MALNICGGKDVSLMSYQNYIYTASFFLVSGQLARPIRHYCRELFVLSTVLPWIIVLRICYDVLVITIEPS